MRAVVTWLVLLFMASSTAYALDPAQVPPPKRTKIGQYLSSKEAAKFVDKNASKALFLDVRTTPEVMFLGMPAQADANEIVTALRNRPEVAQLQAQRIQAAVNLAYAKNQLAKLVKEPLVFPVSADVALRRRDGGFLGEEERREGCQRPHVGRGKFGRQRESQLVERDALREQPLHRRLTHS